MLYAVYNLSSRRLLKPLFSLLFFLSLVLFSSLLPTSYLDFLDLNYPSQSCQTKAKVRRP